MFTSILRFHLPSEYPSPKYRFDKLLLSSLQGHLAVTALQSNWATMIYSLLLSQLIDSFICLKSVRRCKKLLTGFCQKPKMASSNVHPVKSHRKVKRKKKLFNCCSTIRLIIAASFEDSVFSFPFKTLLKSWTCVLWVPGNVWFKVLSKDSWAETMSAAELKPPSCLYARQQRSTVFYLKQYDSI